MEGHERAFNAESGMTETNLESERERERERKRKRERKREKNRKNRKREAFINKLYHDFAQRLFCSCEVNFILI